MYVYYICVYTLKYNFKARLSRNRVHVEGNWTFYPRDLIPRHSTPKKYSLFKSKKYNCDVEIFAVFRKSLEALP